MTNIDNKSHVKIGIIGHVSPVKITLNHSIEKLFEEIDTNCPSMDDRYRNCDWGIEVIDSSSHIQGKSLYLNKK